MFDFYRAEKKADLRGHNGKIRSLSWSAGDLSLISCGQDGSGYHWDVQEGKRVGEFNQKGVGYKSAIMSERENIILAVGSDMMIKVSEEE